MGQGRKKQQELEVVLGRGVFEEASEFAHCSQTAPQATKGTGNVKMGLAVEASPRTDVHHSRGPGGADGSPIHYLCSLTLNSNQTSIF